MVPRRFSHPVVSSPPTQFSSTISPIFQIKRIKLGEEKSLLYYRTMFLLPRSKNCILSTHRKQVESGSEAGLVVLGGEWE
jgi:hypothetical protein